MGSSTYLESRWVNKSSVFIKLDIKWHWNFDAKLQQTDLLNKINRNSEPFFPRKTL